ncbi:hypothetical protein DNU06_06860 [Putridiphycobacter roseus]|uniref:Uncharacterized protein n=1 Tax=Putridiphycobacter roseus TaxID=2219161 RepID=A0A2W1NPI5_9FLAO|nr:hypothetical protein [Putridiphycobacter roseus]PZE17542.1 hypothetical protein DNU06_06860 [Putridiphycobacter roseus]
MKISLLIVIKLLTLSIFLSLWGCKKIKINNGLALEYPYKLSNSIHYYVGTDFYQFKSNYIYHIREGLGAPRGLYKLSFDYTTEKHLAINSNISSVIQLPDGRYLALTPREIDNLYLIPEDFSSYELLSIVNAKSATSLYLANDGIIIIRAEINYGQSYVLKLDFDFEKVWYKSLGLLKQAGHTLNADKKELYLITKENQIKIINTQDGTEIKEFDPKLDIETIVCENDAFYTMGLNGYRLKCTNDIVVRKHDLAGEIIWEHVAGTAKTNDAGSNILITNDQVLISGKYGQPDCFSYGSVFNPNHTSILFLSLNKKTGAVLGSVVKGYDEESSYGGFIIESNNNQLLLLAAEYDKKTKKTHTYLYNVKEK